MRQTDNFETRKDYNYSMVRLLTVLIAFVIWNSYYESIKSRPQFKISVSLDGVDLSLLKLTI